MYYYRIIAYTVYNNNTISRFCFEFLFLRQMQFSMDTELI